MNLTKGVTKNLEEEQWNLVIRPQLSWFDLRLGELWQARDLILLFVQRDFVSVYKQTILGPLWHLVNPLLTTLTLTLVFGRIARLSTDGLPPFLFYMSGTVIWNYFSTCFTGTSSTFTANASIFGKVYFPRLTIPISVLLSRLIAFTIQLLLFLSFLAYYTLTGAGVAPNGWVVILPLLLLLMAGTGLGLGIIISSLTTRYRDLQQLVSFGVSLLMYATPVIYPLSSIDAEYRWLLLANPITPIVEAFRFAFLGSGTLNGWYLLYSAGFMLVTLLVGVLLFKQVEQTFMDTI